MAWPIAIVFIVVASWFVYRYLAPRRWREWARAGLVQAFIIALYAEMYGFPVTLYVLARVFRVDFPWLHSREPLWGALLGLPEGSPAAFGLMVVGMVIGYALVILGVVMLVQGWREVYLANREGRLAKDGMYNLVRHPQYTGILLALFGEGVVHWPTLLTVVLFPVIAVAYWLLARREERKMVEKFGDEYAEYRRRVPMFLPRLGGGEGWRQLWERAFNGRGEAAPPSHPAPGRHHPLGR